MFAITTNKLMTKTVIRNDEVCELPDDAVHPDQVMTFDDVELYCYVRLRGDPGFVIDKGDHLSNRDGRHLLISFTEGADREKNETKLHERVVNKYIHENKHLFVDFQNIIPMGKEPQNYTVPLPE